MLDRVGETDGLCMLATGLLGLQMLGYPKAEMVTGETGDGWHWWVRCDGLRLDPTADQFRDLWVYHRPSGLPLVCRDRFRRSSYREQRSLPVTLENIEDVLRPFLIAPRYDASRGLPEFEEFEDPVQQRWARADALARDALTYTEFWLTQGTNPMHIDLRNLS